MCDRAEAIYKFVADYIRSRGYAPTYREIQDGCDIGSLASIRRWLTHLDGAGKLRWTPGVTRGISLPKNGRRGRSS